MLGGDTAVGRPPAPTFPPVSFDPSRSAGDLGPGPPFSIMADHSSPSDAHFDDGPPRSNGETPAADTPDAEATRPTGDGPDTAGAAASDELGSLQDRLLRVSAEYDNYRRRSVADRQEAVRQGRTSVLMPFLEVYDDLRRSLDAAQRAAEQEPGSPAFDAIRQGVDLVVQKFAAALEQVGVTPIEAVGQPFSEEEHDAMMQQPAPEGTASGTVLAEIQPGYRLDDRVLRHARVIVAE